VRRQKPPKKGTGAMIARSHPRGMNAMAGSPAAVESRMLAQQRLAVLLMAFSSV
jgi:hypothetical protein